MRSTKTSQQKVATICLLLGLTLAVSNPDRGAADRSLASLPVAGVVRFDGPRPQRKLVQLTEKDGKPSDCHRLHKDGLLDENLVVSEQGGLANVFVYVKKGVVKKTYPVPRKPAVLNQKQCMFRPRVQGLMVGQEFVMKNGDPLLHNVRALSFRNRPFNIAQPAESPDRKKVFKRREKAVMIQCDLHPWMTAHVFVMDHPYFAVTNEAGQFRIDGLPAGEYTLAAWHEELGEQEMKFTLGATTDASKIEFSFELPENDAVIQGQLSTDRGATQTPALSADSPPRSFVRMWKFEDLSADAMNLTGRSIERGRQVFNSAGCIKCHPIAGAGAKFGPDLSEVSKRFKGPKLLEQILKPSSEIHKDYQTQLLLTGDGRTVAGLVIKEDSDAIHVLPNPLKPTEVTVVRKTNLDERRMSDLSTMPEDLLITFEKEEILDLLQFLESSDTVEQ